MEPARLGQGTKLTRSHPTSPPQQDHERRASDNPNVNPHAHSKSLSDPRSASTLLSELPPMRQLPSGTRDGLKSPASGTGDRSILCKLAVLNPSLQTLSPHAVLIGVDGGPRLPVGFAPALGFALVPVLLALGDGDFALEPPVPEVKARGDERVTLHLRLRE